MRSLLVLTALLVVTLSGCVSSSDSSVEDLPELQVQQFDLPEVLSGFGDSTSFPLERGGQGIWIHNDILYSTNGGDLEMVSVADPVNPVYLANLTEVGARDVDILEWQGHTYALLAGSGRGMHVVDVTDPFAPELVTTVVLPSAGVHNLAALPGTPYIYSSGASGQTKRIDVLDITDPFNPIIHTFPIPAMIGGVPVTSDGCHDITVRADLNRAYCAGGGGMYLRGGGESFIWDITDPLAPEWISMVDDPRLVYHHQAFVNDDGTILILNDEYISQNCYHAELPVTPPVIGDPAIPFAAAWIYDISDEANPVQMSFVQNPSGWSGDGVPTPGGNCGSHFGDAIPGHDAFVMGWYQGGTMLVTYEEPANPTILAIQPADGSTWDARVYNGHVFHSSSDLQITRLV